MLGLMQDWPLLCHKIIDHAATFHGGRDIISRSVEGPMHRTNYAELHLRAKKVSQALIKENIGLGDRVATLAWNTWRHVEAWYGIMGVGAIYHTVNPRLFVDQIVWIMNHAEDKLLMVDLTFMPIAEQIASQIPSLQKIIVLTDDAHMPETALPNVISYESWIDACDGDFEWHQFDENTAAGMCYTSGTTGDPKGVIYSHRSNVLHALSVNVPDMLGLSSRDRLMPVVPLFHANGWSTAFSAPLTGAALVLPGAAMDGASVHQILNEAQVTMTAAVPTVWLMLLQHLEENGGDFPYLKKVIIGGSACPPAMIEAFETKYNVEVVHAWGMTEMSPLGTLCSIKPEYAHLKGDALIEIKKKQGHPPFGVEMRVTDDDNAMRSWDGKTFGRLKVRGPAIAKQYFKGAGGEIIDEDSFFDTGDVATVDEHGYMHITDRSKDVIKSGGEWISSIELENLAVGHPEVAEAAVIGVPHPKWDERPLLIVVTKPEMNPSKESILSFMEGKIASWWMPNDVVFIDEIPHTATGKIKKTTLHEQFKDYTLPQ